MTAFKDDAIGGLMKSWKKRRGLVPDWDSCKCPTVMAHIKRTRGTNSCEPSNPRSAPEKSVQRHRGNLRLHVRFSEMCCFFILHSFPLLREQAFTDGTGEESMIMKLGKEEDENYSVLTK